MQSLSTPKPNSHTPTPSLLYRTLCSDASGRAPDRERVRFNEAEEAQRRAGAATRPKSMYGCTALDWAHTHKDRSIVRLLEAAALKPAGRAAGRCGLRALPPR